jgi:hypothetical protein
MPCAAFVIWTAMPVEHHHLEHPRPGQSLFLTQPPTLIFSSSTGKLPIGRCSRACFIFARVVRAGPTAQSGKSSFGKAIGKSRTQFRHRSGQALKQKRDRRKDLRAISRNQSPFPSWDLNSGCSNLSRGGRGCRVHVTLTEF